jgi:hypothetical protein
MQRILDAIRLWKLRRDYAAEWKQKTAEYVGLSGEELKARLKEICDEA